MKETVGERIKRVRTERGISQRELAQQAPLASSPYISRIETNDRQPSIEIIRQIAKALDVSPVYIETGAMETCPHCGSKLGG